MPHGFEGAMRQQSDIIHRKGAQTSLSFWLSLTPKTLNSSRLERKLEADSGKRPIDYFWR